MRCVGFCVRIWEKRKKYKEMRCGGFCVRIWEERKKNKEMRCVGVCVVFSLVLPIRTPVNNPCLHLFPWAAQNILVPQGPLLQVLLHFAPQSENEMIFYSDFSKNIKKPRTTLESFHFLIRATVDSKWNAVAYENVCFICGFVFLGWSNGYLQRMWPFQRLFDVLESHLDCISHNMANKIIKKTRNP